MNLIVLGTLTVFLSIVLFVTSPFAARLNSNIIIEKENALSEDWYQGKAEVSTFELQQNRYNDIHEGELVMIFVTEDFLKDKQVKNDSYTSSKSTPILKNNRIRKFTTGLYDYSVYTSTFTDVNPPGEFNTLKVTMSSQDWCGQSFAQINNQGKVNKVSSYSYFESEGDQIKKIEDVLLLDEVFNLLRIAPESLPNGPATVFPSLLFSRLKHLDYASFNAVCNFEDEQDNVFVEGPLKSYNVKIPELKFELEVVYQDKGNREIIAFRESYPSAFDGQIRETIATRKSIEWIDYWSKNAVEDYALRQKLKINYQ